MSSTVRSTCSIPARVVSSGVPRRIGDRDVQLAAIDRRNVLEADQAQRDQQQREDQRERRDQPTSRGRFSPQVKRAIDVPRARALEAVGERVDEAPRTPGRKQRPAPGERRRDGERDEQRGQRRDRDDQAELAQEQPDRSRQERDRQEDDDVDQRDHDRGDADLAAAGDCGLPPAPRRRGSGARRFRARRSSRRPRCR